VESAFMEDKLYKYKIGELLNQNEIENLINQYNNDTIKYKPCRGGKIIIIDNDKETLITLKEIINDDTAYSVSATYRNIKRILHIVNEVRPDIILMNIDLIDNIKVIADILKDHPNIHILIISNQSYKSLIIKTLEIGVTNFILKPIDKKFFADVINNIPKENIYSNQKYKRPIPIESLTQKILTKSRLELKLIVELWRENPWNHCEFFSQIWKDKRPTYSIVYIDSPLCSFSSISSKDIVTFDISINDGELIERALSKGIFKLFSYSEHKSLNTGKTFIRPFIYNDKNLFYVWDEKPQDEEFKIIENIIKKYVNNH